MSRPVSLRASCLPVKRWVRSRVRSLSLNYSPTCCTASSVRPQQQQQHQQQQQSFPNLGGVEWPLTLALSGIASAVVYGVTVLLKSQPRLVAPAILIPMLAFFVGRQSIKHHAQVRVAKHSNHSPHIYGSQWYIRSLIAYRQRIRDRKLLQKAFRMLTSNCRMTSSNSNSRNCKQ